MPLIARQRSRLAVLAVLALVGSLLAVSAVPAVAATDEAADEKAMYSACVGAAEDDAGFADMRGNFAEDEANCLAHYGITLGTGNDEDGNPVYGPNSSVTRWQMALFLSRAAGPAGIELPMASDQMLSDIGSLDDGTQDAINQMADLGIMAPRSSGMFDPDGVVSRQDMAVHLAGFLSNAVTGPGGVDIDDLKNGRASGKSPFTDIEGVTVAAHKSIRDIFELGVAEGTSTTEFSPDAPVRRDQMAAFITRALGHTNARPAGLSAQGPDNADTDDQVTVVVSVRDMDHQPTPDALVGAITSTTPDEAFDDEGACVADKSDGSCSISTGNEQTDPDGNAELPVSTPDSAGTLTVWVWTGDAGDKFDADTTDRATLEIDVALPATKVILSEDTKENSQFLKFGDTVTYTLQVVNDEGDPVAKADVAVMVTAVTQTVTVAEADRATTSVAGAAASTTVNTHKTDSAGRIEISFTQDDPDDADDSTNRVQLSLAAVLTADGELDELAKAEGFNDQLVAPDSEGDATAADEDLDNVGVLWSDADSVATTLTVGQATKYHETNEDGVRNVVTATLVDQYGDPLRSQSVSIWSTVDNSTTAGSGLGGPGDGAGSATNAFKRTTNRHGVANRSYTRTVEAQVAEELDAQYVLQRGTCLDSLDTCTETAGAEGGDLTIDADAINHEWVMRVPGPTGTDASADSTGAILILDKDNNSIVIGASGSGLLATWDSGDYFAVSGAPVSMAAFVKSLDEGDSVTVTVPAAKDGPLRLNNTTG